jgi:hypothetical protein
MFLNSEMDEAGFSETPANFYKTKRRHGTQDTYSNLYLIFFIYSTPPPPPVVNKIKRFSISHNFSVYLKVSLDIDIVYICDFC